MIKHTTKQIGDIGEEYAVKYLEIKNIKSLSAIIKKSTVKLI